VKWFKYIPILAALAACHQQRPLPPIDLAVDPTITPPIAALPGFEDGAPRPVASVTGDDGTQAEFVANEVWLQSDDEREVQDFLARWQGQILRTFEPDDHGLSELPTQYLIRIDAAGADTSRLSADLRALDPHATGSHKVSSQAGLELIAATSQEAASGLQVGMNWVGGGSAFRTKSSLEAPSGGALAGVVYRQNAFDWPSHDVGSNQDIGVAEAWRALDLAGKLTNRIKLAVLDMGFQPDDDWRSNYEAISNVPFQAAIGTENLLECGGGPCPWHGTSVVSAAMALPDNRYGGAGPGGPVADPIVVFTLYDFFTSTTALGAARLHGARIANMSYSAPVPWYLGWSVLPFEAATAAFRASGMLLFASAGNEGKDVDAEGCTLRVCWERTWYTPCENAGVICVGGLAGNSTNKAGGSNYGGDQVDIFAPFTLWLGPDPDSPDNQAHVRQGTSFSSPFTAGVAALIWAADPGLGADEVEEILITTAHRNADSRVRRHVNALAAVRAVLGNVPPSITFPSLQDGSTLPLNLLLSLDASVTDFEDASPCCTIVWSSNIDGALGSGRSVQHAFTTPGSRTLTVRATDSRGATSVVSVNVTIVNALPRAAISKPLPGDEALRTVPFVLRGRADDFNEPGGSLDCNNLTWTSSVPSDPFPVTGCELEVTFVSNGTRTLTLTATDPQGASDTAEVSLGVIDPPPDLPPFVQVSSPEDHGLYPIDEPITLSGTAIDPEGATPLSFQWTVKLNDLAPIVVGNAPAIQWTPSDTYDFRGEGTYVIQVSLRVTDPQGNTGTDFVVLEFSIIN
jgi:serine protease